jgi:hypothetical protein
VLYLIENMTTMNLENKIKDVIEMLEDAISLEDWKLVDEARKELTFLFEEIESSFPMDGYDDEELD